MNGSEALIDTNIIIYYLNGELTLSQMDGLWGIINNGLRLSVISQIEVMSWHRHTAQSATIAQRFLASATIVQLSPEVVARTIAIRREARLKLPDAVIAATALTHNLTLVTHNTRDFTRVEGLRLHDPLA